MKFVFFLLALISLLHAKGIEDAKAYHKNSPMQWHVAMQAIDLIPWQDSERILDIGCGDGKITALLTTKVPNGSVVGIDISQSMIDFASSNYPQIDFPNLTFLTGNATELPFEQQFDRVVSFSTLHWVLDQAKVLKGIYRSLVSGGEASLHTYSNSPMNVVTVAESLIRTEKWAPYFPSYTKQRIFVTAQEYRTLLEQAHFQQIQILEFCDDTPFPNRESLIHFLEPVLTFTRHLPLDLQQEFAEEVADSLITIAQPSEDGMIHFRTFNLQARAVK